MIFTVFRTFFSFCLQIYSFDILYTTLPYQDTDQFWKIRGDCTFVAPTPTGFAVSDSDKSKVSSVVFELFLIEFVGRGLGSHNACLSIILLRLFYFLGFGATLSDTLRFASGFKHRRPKHEH